MMFRCNNALSRSFGKDTANMLWRDDPRHGSPPGGRLKYQWAVEIKDGKVTEHVEERVVIDRDTDWTAKSVPARVLPNGGRTIRPE